MAAEGVKLVLFDGRRWKGVAAVMEGGASQANPTLMAALTCKPANKPPDPVITASAVLLRPSGDQTQLQTRRDEATKRRVSKGLSGVCGDRESRRANASKGRNGQTDGRRQE